MCQLTNFRTSNEETEFKIRIYAEKLSKISLVENFDFWSKVNAKSQSQLVQGQSQWSVLTGQIQGVRVGSVQVNGQLGDMVLTRRHY